MSSNSADSSPDCIALAVAFFQAPSQFPELLRGEGRLPQGLTELLLIAAGNPQSNGANPLSPFAQAEELQKAAKFFIEQVLLAHNASHYRVFGVEPDASLAEIKDSHRLLMRLFHPDRQIDEAEGATAIATRINQAYTVLRSPETRAAYDFSLHQRQAAVQKIPAYPVPRHAPAPLRTPFTLPLFIARNLEPFILGSVALVAALGVALVYVNHLPERTPDTVGPAAKHKPEMAKTRPALSPEAQARVALAALPLEPPAQYLLSEASVQPPEAPARIADAMEPATLAMPTAPPDRPPTPATDNKQPRSEPTRAPSPAPQPAVTSDKPKMAAATTAEPVVATVAVNAPGEPEMRPSPPRPEQLDRLVANFSELFQRGDLESLLALFDDTARMDRGSGKAQVRSEYGELFRSSETRTLYIWDMTWNPRGKAVRGNGHFQSRVIGKADRSPRIYGGDITIDVLQQDGNPLIVGLYRKTN